MKERESDIENISAALYIALKWTYLILIYSSQDMLWDTIKVIFTLQMWLFNWFKVRLELRSELLAMAWESPSQKDDPETIGFRIFMLGEVMSKPYCTHVNLKTTYYEFQVSPPFSVCKNVTFTLLHILKKK